MDLHFNVVKECRTDPALAHTRRIGGMVVDIRASKDHDVDECLPLPTLAPLNR